MGSRPRHRGSYKSSPSASCTNAHIICSYKNQHMAVIGFVNERGAQHRVLYGPAGFPARPFVCCYMQGLDFRIPESSSSILSKLQNNGRHGFTACLRFKEFLGIMGHPAQ